MILSWIRQEYLQKFTPPPTAATPSVAAALTQRLACRVCVCYATHAVLVKPVTDDVVQQMAQDMSSVCTAISVHVYPIDLLGSPYTATRTIRAILTMPLTQLMTSSLLHDVPRHLAILALIMKSGLQSPLERLGVSPQQYVLWLDGHTSEEIVEGLKTAIDAQRRSCSDDEATKQALLKIDQLIDEAT